MKILISAYGIDPKGGSESRTGYEVVLGALKNNLNVLLATNNLDKLSDSEVIPFIKSSNLVLLNISPTFPKVSKIIPGSDYINYLVWQWSLHLTLKKNQLNFDLAHHISWGNVSLGTGLKDISKPYIFGPAGGGSKALKKFKAQFEHDWPLESLRNLFLLNAHKLPFIRKSIKNATKVLVTNRDTQDFVAVINPRSELFLADAISSHEIVSHRYFPRDEIILWVGRFMPRKAPLLAIKAFHRISTQFPGAKLIMIGDGVLIKKARELAITLELQKRIIFLGWLPWDEVQQYYEKSRCLLFTSLRESFGRQILEAAGRGLPGVILSDLPANEWIPRNAMVSIDQVGSLDLTDTFAAGIKEILLMNEREWRKMSSKCIEFARINTWENLTEKLKLEYENIFEEFNH